MNEIRNANARHIWTVLCQSATIDAETKDLSMSKVIDGLTLGFDDVNKLQEFSAKAAEKPAVAPVESELVMMFKKIDRAQEAAFDVRVRYVDPAGAELQSMEFPLAMEKGTFRHRHRLNVPAIVVSMSGEYRFVVEAKARTDSEYGVIAEIPLDINFKLEQKKG